MTTMPAQKPGRSKQDYGTPDDFIRAVQHRFGPLACDLAADESNAKAKDFLCKELDSLTQDWARYEGNLWLNPPFADIDPWAEKCKQSTGDGRRILFLTPASIGANWFANHVWGYARVYALRGRLSFDGKDPYPKDCCLSVFGDVPGFEIWKWQTRAEFVADAGCAACDRGIPVEGNEFKHTGTGTACRPPAEEKSPLQDPPKKRGRPKKLTEGGVTVTKEGDAPRKIVAPPPATNGTIHLVEELGEHPALVEENRKASLIRRGIEEKILDGSEPPGEAWVKLTRMAPAGWFKNASLPQENISSLTENLVKRGVPVSLIDVCGWSVMQRDVARAWVEQMGDPPEFFPKAVEAIPERDVVAVASDRLTPAYEF